MNQIISDILYAATIYIMGIIFGMVLQPWFAKRKLANRSKFCGRNCPAAPKTIEEYEADLQYYVDTEQYEKASQLRDFLQSKQSQNNNNS